MNDFITERESIAGAPSITFAFKGDTVRAELAGAKLYGEVEALDRARVSVRDKTGALLADITIHGASHDTLTEAVSDVGSALLWSHWQWLLAKAREEAKAPQ